jgi:hypothetical protein
MVLAAAIAAAVNNLRRSMAMGSSELAVSAVSILPSQESKGWRSAAFALFGHIPCRETTVLRKPVGENAGVPSS